MSMQDFHLPVNAVFNLGAGRDTLRLDVSSQAGLDLNVQIDAGKGNDDVAVALSCPSDDTYLRINGASGDDEIAASINVSSIYRYHPLDAAFDLADGDDRLVFDYHFSVPNIDPSQVAKLGVNLQVNAGRGKDRARLVSHGSCNNGLESSHDAQILSGAAG